LWLSGVIFSARAMARTMLALLSLVASLSISLMMPRWTAP
jgi:hypothetical protein